MTCATILPSFATATIDPASVETFPLPKKLNHPRAFYLIWNKRLIALRKDGEKTKDLLLNCLNRPRKTIETDLQDVSQFTHSKSQRS